jgi:hypothetical protein
LRDLCLPKPVQTRCGPPVRGEFSGTTGRSDARKRSANHRFETSGRRTGSARCWIPYANGSQDPPSTIVRYRLARTSGLLADLRPESGVRKARARRKWRSSAGPRCLGRPKMTKEHRRSLLSARVSGPAPFPKRPFAQTPRAVLRGACPASRWQADQPEANGGPLNVTRELRALPRQLVETECLLRHPYDY